MKLKEWLKPILRNEFSTDETILNVRASLDENSTDLVWTGNIRDFFNQKPNIGWNCYLSRSKIEDLIIVDAVVDDGEEDSITVNVKGRKETDLYVTDRVP